MRKLLLVMTLLLTISFVLPAYTDAAIPAADDFLTDIDMQWYEPYVQTLYDMGVLNGDQTRANGDSNVTRGEFVALLTRAFYNLEGYVGATHFPDVKPGDLFYENISMAAQNGLVQGDSAGRFNRDAHITREEIVLIVSRLLRDKPADGSVSFSDIKKNYPYRTELARAVSLGVITGYDDNTFRPYQNATRAESAVMILNAFSVYGSKGTDTEVLQFAENYFANDRRDPASNLDSATGTEAKDIKYRDEILKFIAAQGASVQKNTSGVQFTLQEQTNNTATVLARFATSHTVQYAGGEQKTRSYDGETTLYLLKRAGYWKVYRTDAHLKVRGKINLTWEVFQNPPDYAPDGVNVISPTWYELIADNSFPNAPVVYSDSSTTIRLTDKANQKYLDYVRNNGYDLWIAYRNDFNTHNTRKFMSSADARIHAVKLVIQGVLKTRADGINMDFENMLDRDVYTRHVKEIALAMRELGLVTSVDINKYEKTGGSWSLCFDRDAIDRVADYSVVMAYDQYGTFSTSAGPVAGLSWVRGVVQNVLREVAPERLVLGVPFYVRVWQEQNGKVVKTSAVSMERAAQLIRENNGQISYNSTDGQDVATWKSGNTTYKVWIEDAASISRKAALIKEYGLAGVASWRRGFETSDIWQTLINSLS